MRRILVLIVIMVGGVVLLGASAQPASAIDGLSFPDESLLTDPIWARTGGFSNYATLFAQKTRYLLMIDIDPYRGRMAGRARILYVNNTPAALDTVVFRLYPNHPVHGNRHMTIEDVLVNGQPASGNYRDSNQTSYGVVVGAPLPPGGT